MNTFPFAEYIVPAIFALAVLTTLAGTIVAVTSTRIIRSVGGLMICCMGLAGLYLFLASPFLALMEILIYVGAVCVTIVFGVMLSEPDEPNGDPKRRAIGWTLAAAAVAGAIGIGLARLSLTAPWPAQPVHLLNNGSVAAIGTSLLTTYSLAFEVISLVLLVAILGALVIARSGRKPANAHETIAAAVERTTVAGTAGPAGRGRAGSASLRSETAAPVAATHP
jgi:NADH-quinone oxidoreductase subunit J